MASNYGLFGDDHNVPVRRCTPCPKCGHAAVYYCGYVENSQRSSLYHCTALYCGILFSGPTPNPDFHQVKILDSSQDHEVSDTVTLRDREPKMTGRNYGSEIAPPVTPGALNEFDALGAIGGRVCIGQAVKYSRADLCAQDSARYTGYHYAL